MLLRLKKTNKSLKRFKGELSENTIVTITDDKGVIKYVNDYFCQVSQYSKDEIIGKTHSLINSGFHTKVFIKDLWDTINSGEIWTGKIKNKAKDGSYYWVFTNIIPFKNQNGVITEFLAIKRLIDENDN